MATTSTEDQNDPTLDNREEYSPPPCIETLTTAVEFDSDGFEQITEVMLDVNSVAS